MNHSTAARRFMLKAVVVVCHEIVFNVSTFVPSQSKHHSVNGISQEIICTLSSYRDVVSFLDITVRHPSKLISETRDISYTPEWVPHK
jgi:hypothetical protein